MPIASGRTVRCHDRVTPHANDQALVCRGLSIIFMVGVLRPSGTLASKQWPDASDELVHSERNLSAGTGHRAPRVAESHQYPAGIP